MYISIKRYIFIIVDGLVTDTPGIDYTIFIMINVCIRVLFVYMFLYIWKIWISISISSNAWENWRHVWLENVTYILIDFR